MVQRTHTPVKDNVGLFCYSASLIRGKLLIKSAGKIVKGAASCPSSDDGTAFGKDGVPPAIDHTPDTQRNTPRTMNEKKIYRSRPKDKKPVAAPDYINKRFGSKKMQRINQVEQDFAQEVFNLVGKDGVILDMPCGSGRFTEVFSKAKKLYSIDVNEGMLEEAKLKAEGCDHCEFLIGSIHEIPLDDNTVDLAFCMRLLHHVPTREERCSILAELSRVSKKWVVVTYYRKESWRYIRKKIRGKRISGQPIRRKIFLEEARMTKLELVKQVSIRNSRQTMAIFKKK